MTQSHDQSFPRLLNVNETAALLSVSPKTVYYWVERREIPFIKVGRHVRFKAHEVIGFFEQKTAQEKPPCHLGQLIVNNSFSRSLKIRGEEPASSCTKPEN